MFLHIGSNKTLRAKEIIGIFDTDNATVSTVTRKFLADAEKRGEVAAASDEIPKSFVLTGDKNKQNIWFSQLNSGVLYHRIGACEEYDVRAEVPPESDEMNITDIPNIRDIPDITDAPDAPDIPDDPEKPD